MKRRIIGYLLPLAHLFITSPPAWVQDFSYDLSGYAKNLVIRSESVLDGEPYLLNISRLRAQSAVDLGEVLHGELWLDTELLAGNFLTTLDYQLTEALERPTFVDLSWKIKREDKYQARQSFFRAYARLYLAGVDITLGRQRIAWGTGFAWNPTDLLNPFNPAAIELAEKEGVDALHVSWPFGTLSQVEAAFAPGRNELRSSFAARWSSNVGNYDISIMGGDFGGAKVVGGDFAGYLGGAGFRGEAAHTIRDEGRNFTRAVLNADYSFSRDIYAMLEFYYNGAGEVDKSKYDRLKLLTEASFNLGRTYLALSLTKSLTPLLNLSVYGILNLNDGSHLAGPALIYSIAENLEVAANVYLFNGGTGSEYGPLEDIFFTSLQYYF